MIPRNFMTLKAGIVLFKGNNLPQVTTIRAARLECHLTASIDWEVFGLIDASGKRIHDRRPARHCNLFLTQGNFQQDFLEQYQGIPADRIKVVGNPRIDLSSGPAGAALDEATPGHSKADGPFVLINTNFAAVNPHDQDTHNYFQRCISIRAIDPAAPENVGTIHQLCEFEIGNLRAIPSFIAEIGRLSPETKIALRPHPAEDPGSWHAAPGKNPNVLVIENNRH